MAETTQNLTQYATITYFSKILNFPSAPHISIKLCKMRYI